MSPEQNVMELTPMESVMVEQNTVEYQRESESEMEAGGGINDSEMTTCFVSNLTIGQ